MKTAADLARELHATIQGTSDVNSKRHWHCIEHSFERREVRLHHGDDARYVLVNVDENEDASAKQVAFACVVSPELAEKLAAVFAQAEKL